MNRYSSAWEHLRVTEKCAVYEKKKGEKMKAHY
jgi:hypothetical protein